jgi:integrase
MKGIYQRGKNWQVKKLFKGHERVSATFPSKDDAIAFIKQCELAVLRGEPLPSPTGAGTTSAARKRTLGDIYDEAVAIKWNTNRSDSSPANARKFVKWAGPATPAAEAFSVDSLNNYVRYRQGLGNGGKTINKKLSAVKVMMGVAFDLGVINGMAKLPRQREAAGRLRYFTVEEQRVILHWTRHLGLHEWADYWQFLVDTGARMGEARLVRWTEFRGNRVTFVAPDTKTLTTRTVPLTQACLDALARRKADPARADSPGPFSWASKDRTTEIWNKLRKFVPFLAGEDTIPYTFRHTCASRLAMSGKSAPLIKAWMGHATLATTERYMHLAPSAIDDLAGALETFKDPELAA